MSWTRQASAGIAVISVVTLCGCTGSFGSADPPTTTVTETTTVTATPPPATASPDEPLDELSTWTACAVLAQEVYGKDVPTATMASYSDSHPPHQDADGTWWAEVAFTLSPPTDGTSLIVISCHLSGTKGAPDYIGWSGKDL